jgi:hypothetical protein
MLSSSFIVWWSKLVIMSPPTKPALSAGPPGGSTTSNVAPPSVVSKPLTPKYERLDGMVNEPLGECVPLKRAPVPPPTAKNNPRPIHIQVMPVKPRRRRRGCIPPAAGRLIGALTFGKNGVVPVGRTALALGRRTVSVYSAGPSPRRFPQERQKRIPCGIGEPHCEQTTELCWPEPD